MKRSYQLEQIEKKTTDSGLEYEVIKVRDVETQALEDMNLGLLAYNDVTQEYYEDEEHKAKRIEMINEILGFEYPNFNSIIGNEYDFFFDPKTYKVYFKEPTRFYKAKEVPDKLIKAVIKNAFIKPKEGIKIFLEYEDGIIQVGALGFTSMNKDKKYEYVQSKVPKQINKINDKIDESDLNIDHIYYEPIESEDNNIDTLIGLTMQIKKNKFGKNEFFEVNGLYE